MRIFFRGAFKDYILYLPDFFQNFPRTIWIPTTCLQCKAVAIQRERKLGSTVYLPIGYGWTHAELPMTHTATFSCMLCYYNKIIGHAGVESTNEGSSRVNRIQLSCLYCCINLVILFVSKKYIRCGGRMSRVKVYQILIN